MRVIALYLIFITTSLFCEISSDIIQQSYSDSYAYESQERYSEAIKTLEPIVTSYSDSYTVNYRLGWLYYLNGNYANSQYHLGVALKQFPSSVEVLNCLTLIYMAKKDWEEAELNSYKVISIDYYNYYGNYRYAYSLKMVKKYDLAEKVCRKILAIYPSDITFLGELGEILILSGETKDGVKILENLLMIDSDNSIATKYLK